MASVGFTDPYTLAFDGVFTDTGFRIMLNLANGSYQPRATVIVSGLTSGLTGEEQVTVEHAPADVQNPATQTKEQAKVLGEYKFWQSRSKLHTDAKKPSRPQTVHRSVQSGGKRFIDLVGSVLGLTVLGVVVVPIAIAIRLDSPGPIFYSQMRCGLNGKPFRIWKLRSMVCQAEQLQHLVSNQAKGGIFKNKHDPRVTRVGRFLRKTSLDEFPQFWNVLRGEMSLVGTRPPTVSEVLTYKAHHWKRLRVKPGITGEWQANGRSSVEDFEDVVKMDLDYQRKWSVLYDLHLIWKTIQVVFTGHGAY